MTFLLAGHETTSNALSWGFYFLAKHPREQDLLREELVKAFPDNSTFDPTFDEINSLEYLNCITKEVLRLVPPLIGAARYTTEDRVLGGHFIPKNTQIDIPITALHRSPSIWGPTANEFDPKRWLNPSLIKNVTNYNYLPFLTGARSCIGMKVATSEFKIVLSMLIRNFVFQTGPLVMKKKPGFLSKPDPYLELIVSKVEI
ncbi:19443_t:CDS:2 [Funneliformis geosporum]|uniref:19443_t:CDS:1 n=1 Tax=Funneliformis geosporum TaxID=1117311 RepID=A0A9W4T313_9GLOM|nr:19443_t:CDS:2 [Funneliformis geosporum]